MAEENNTLFMIPSIRDDHVATFHTIAGANNWTTQSEGHAGDGMRNRPVFILKLKVHIVGQLFYLH